MSEPKRAHETRIEIDAPIEEVWKALTEPDAIVRWFSPKSTVQPGAGGTMVADWGPGLEWKTVIEVWEPNQHLRLAETRDRIMTAAPEEQRLEPCRLVQDFYLEGQGGKTVLRLVHSGFGSSLEWNQEYEGTREGWASCFLRLKQVLEFHKKESVHNFIVTTLCYATTYKQALEKLLASAPAKIDMRLRGEYMFCGLMPELNGSIVNISAQPSTMGTVLYSEFALYGMSDDKAAAVKNTWRAALTRLFPESATSAVS